MRDLQAECDRLGDQVECLELALVEVEGALADEWERAQAALQIARMGALPVVARATAAVAGGVRQ